MKDIQELIDVEYSSEPGVRRIPTVLQKLVSEACNIISAVTTVEQKMMMMIHSKLSMVPDSALACVSIFQSSKSKELATSPRKLEWEETSRNRTV
jgi:hypothetical protein